MKNSHSLALLTLVALGLSSCAKVADPLASDTGVLLSGCALISPIALGARDVSKDSFTLSQVKLDQVIRTQEFVSAESIQIGIFPIKKLPYTGASIKSVTSDGTSVGFDLGFANDYGGNFSFSGGTSQTNSTYIYNTISDDGYKAPGNKNSQHTELKMVIENQNLLSLQMTIPVRKQQSSNSFYFADENQTLCVTSAVLK